MAATPPEGAVVDVDEPPPPTMTSATTTAATATSKNTNTHTTDARLHWESIRLMVQVSKDKSVTILDNVWGEAPQGQVTAIMGPSGSG